MYAYKILYWRKYGLRKNKYFYYFGLYFTAGLNIEIHH